MPNNVRGLVVDVQCVDENGYVHSVPVTSDGKLKCHVDGITIGDLQVFFPQSNVADTNVFEIGDEESVQVLGANPSRVGFTINNKLGILFVNFGLNVSSSLYTYRLTPNSSLTIDNYCGPVSAIKEAGTSPVIVTELV